MNNKYIEKEENKYIVLDENNKVSLVESNNDIEEILNLENDLEIERKNLNECEKIINVTEQNEKTKKFMNKIVATGEGILLILALFPFFTINWFLLVGIVYAFYYVALLLPLLGTSHKNITENAKKSLEKEVSLANIEVLEKKIEKLKTKSNYKVEKLTDYIDNNYTYHENALENKNNVKKLILKKDK